MTQIVLIILLAVSIATSMTVNPVLALILAAVVLVVLFVASVVRKASRQRRDPNSLRQALHEALTRLENVGDDPLFCEDLRNRFNLPKAVKVSHETRPH